MVASSNMVNTGQSQSTEVNSSQLRCRSVHPLVPIMVMMKLRTKKAKRERERERERKKKKEEIFALDF